MFYAKIGCPICGTGVVGFYLCSDQITIVLMCDECDAVWLDPTTTDGAHALYLGGPPFMVPGTDCSLQHPPARWANASEIARRGWSRFVAGEGDAMGEAFERSRKKQ